jgi:hypothetical protein
VVAVNRAEATVEAVDTILLFLLVVEVMAVEADTLHPAAEDIHLQDPVAKVGEATPRPNLPAVEAVETVEDITLPVLPVEAVAAVVADTILPALPAEEVAVAVEAVIHPQVETPNLLPAEAKVDHCNQMVRKEIRSPLPPLPTTTRKKKVPWMFCVKPQDAPENRYLLI